jgi:nicotinate dehydrogenase subunit A
MSEYDLVINGKHTLAEADPRTPLLYVLRQVGIISPRYGCGLEQCGSCRVLVNGELEYACTKTIAEIAGARVETVEGLAENGLPDILQQAFLDENAGQCGYCLSGIIMTAKHLLGHNSRPDRGEIQDALKNNLCRCGAHNRIIRAIERAAEQLESD